MNKQYVIKIIDSNESYPYYLTEIYVGYTENPFSPKASFSYKKSTHRVDALIFESLDDMQIAWNFVNAYNKKFHKAYKLEIVEI